MSSDVVRLEEFTGRLLNKIAIVFEGNVAGWLPTEFMASQYITRILVAGRTSATSTVLASDPDWTQVWRVPGAKEWSCLLGILQHLPGPILLVIASDVAMSPKILSALRSVSDSTTVLIRSPSSPAIDHMDHNTQIFFPVMDGTSKASNQIMNHLNDWIGRIGHPIDIKAVLPSLASAGYGLTITDGSWYWYNPSESPPTSALTVAQLGKQIQVLGFLVEGFKRSDS